MYAIYGFIVSIKPDHNSREKHYKYKKGAQQDGEICKARLNSKATYMGGFAVKTEFSIRLYACTLIIIKSDLYFAK